MFKALSVETRVRIVEALRSRSLCVNALARELGITPAAVSQHLRVLRDMGMVTAERRGYYVHYRVSGDALAEWQRMAASLLGDAAGGDPFGEARPSPPGGPKTEREAEVKEDQGEVGGVRMGDDKTKPCCCQRPEELRGRPGECSKEQIEKCHGTTDRHPCTEEKEGEER